MFSRSTLQQLYPTEDRMTLVTNRPRWQKWAGYLGWGLFIFTNLTLLAVLNTQPITTINEAYLELAIRLVGIVTLMISVALLLARYTSFFRQPRGTFLFLAIILGGAVLLATPALNGHSQEVVRRLMIIGGMWTLTALFAIGGSLALYLFSQDRSVVLVSVVCLGWIWVFMIIVQLLGPTRVVTELYSEQISPTLALFGSGSCAIWWLIVIAPVSFLLHSTRLIYEEFSLQTSY